jgi:hypothetical protein
MATDVRPRLAELQAEEADAWAAYMEETAGKEGASYREIEPWAWARLRTVLARIKRERKRLTS